MIPRVLIFLRFLIYSKGSRLFLNIYRPTIFPLIQNSKEDWSTRLFPVSRSNPYRLIGLQNSNPSGTTRSLDRKKNYKRPRESIFCGRKITYTSSATERFWETFILEWYPHWEFICLYQKFDNYHHNETTVWIKVNHLKPFEEPFLS